MKKMSILGSLTIIAAMLVTPCNVLSQESKEREAGSSFLPLNALVEVKPRMEAYIKARNQQIVKLALKYERVIESRLNKAADSGDFKTAKPFQEEKERVEALLKLLTVEEKDPLVAAQRSDTLPNLPPGAQEALVGLRKIWTTEWQKIRIKLDGDLQQSLKKVEIDLTKARDLKKAKEVLIYRELLLSGAPVVKVAVANSKGTPAPISSVNKSSHVPDDAITFGNGHYKIYIDTISWNEAKKKCRRLRGQLVVIHDEATSAFIKGIAQNRSLWLGATDAKKEGEWIWVDDSKMEFDNWGPRSPSNTSGVEHYVATHLDTSWNDLADFPGLEKIRPVGYICHWPAEK